jgi:hypothetical protein
MTRSKTLQDTINDAEHTLALLKHPVVARLSRQYPEAYWHTYISPFNGPDSISATIYLHADGQHSWDDISGVANTATTDGYVWQVPVFDKVVSLRYKGRKVSISLELSVHQPYTTAEKKLLKKLGKLIEVKERKTKSYTALVCN